MRFLLAALLLLPVAASAQGIQTPPNQAATFSATAPSGNNGFVCKTTGCRIDLGSGANDYAYSDGNNITTPGVWAAGSNGPSYIGLGIVRWGTGQALVTCGTVYEGAVYRMTGTGGTNSGSQTRLCACVSDGAASPTYLWRNLISGTAGNSTTCNP